LNFSLTTKFEGDEQFSQFKDRIRLINDLLKKIKLNIRVYDDIFAKIKDYKSQKNESLLAPMAHLAKYANASKEKLKVIIF
jgi:hypothetical protein